jgi:hypothetical protein
VTHIFDGEEVVSGPPFGSAGATWYATFNSRADAEAYVAMKEIEGE